MNIDNDTIPYRKRSKKTPPKKADHKHEYEPVILEYWNDHLNFDREKGWVGGYDMERGSRCRICGKLALGFPRSSEENAMFSGRFGMSFSRRDVLSGEEFRHLDVCNVKDIWDL